MQQPEVRLPGQQDRRQHTRYLLARPIFVIPIQPDCTPDKTYEACGFSWDVSARGLLFDIPRGERLPSGRLLVGVEGSDATYHFATAEVRRAERSEVGLRIGAEFVSGQRDLLARDNLYPSLVPATWRFQTGLEPAILSRWVELGVMRPVMVDRVLVCPQCQGASTFRNGCRACGSVRVTSRKLIHHFACAHVGFVEDYDRAGELTCPKCRTRDLIVGADFEYLNGPYHCLDCDWSDADLSMVGQCQRCALRFPLEQACDLELIGYHVNRLDPLALVHAA